MGERAKTYIFHIFRKDGSSLLLHPLSTPEKVVNQLEGVVIEGRYGLEPRVEALTLFRNELYRQIELGVKSWLNDVRFVPKFLIAAGVFIVTYFFFSYVVRDPLPVIDEIVLGLAAGVVVFILQGRRDLASKAAVKKRLNLRIIVDRITFRESDFVKQVEEALHHIEMVSAEEVVKRIIEPVQQELGEPCKLEASQFIRMLESRFNFKKLQREERVFRRFVQGASPPGREIARLFESKKYDFPLYAVYKSFKKTVANLK